jgi:hypothetical protein
MTKYKPSKPVIAELGIYAAALGVATLVFVIVYFLVDESGADYIVDFYQTNMRASMFTGFLTAGSFLLSLKTGIVIKIKESVYDKDSYQERVSKAIDAGSNVTFYGPLKRLSRVLSAAVFTALMASLCQLTIGLRMEWQAMAACLSIAALAFSMLVAAFLLIQVILSDWFKNFDEDARKAHRKRLDKEKDLATTTTTTTTAG